MRHREAGEAGRQGVEAARNYVHYFRPTRDGRILWGGTDAVYRYGGPISPRRDRHEAIRRRLEAKLVATFPQLGRVRFTHHWGGPISITARSVPRIGRFDGGRVHYAFGYSGHGVAPAHTAVRILRDLVLARDTEDTSVCFVEHPTRARACRRVPHLAPPDVRPQFLRGLTTPRI